jgi:hypothetical protein
MDPSPAQLDRHRLALEGLSPETTYEAVVAAVNPCGSAVRGYVFTTK